MVSSGASHPRHFYADTLRLQPPVAQAKFGTKWFFQGFQGSHPLGRAGMWTLPRVGISPRSPIVQDPSDCVSEGVPTADAAPPPRLGPGWSTSSVPDSPTRSGSKIPKPCSFSL